MCRNTRITDVTGLPSLQVFAQRMKCSLLPDLPHRLLSGPCWPSLSAEPGRGFGLTAREGGCSLTLLSGQEGSWGPVQETGRWNQEALADDGECRVGGAVNSLPSWDLELGAELTVGLCWGRWDPAWTGQEEAGVGLQRGHHHSKGSRCKEHQRQNRGPQSPLA